MSILGFLSDQYYLEGLKKQKLESYQKAIEIFPFARPILMSEGEYYSSRKNAEKVAFDAYKKLLLYDPYSAEYLAYQMQLAFIFKDNDLAVKSFNILKKIAPTMPIVKSVEQRR